MSYLLTKTEAAAQLGKSERTLERLIKKELIPVVREGSRVLIRPADVHAYISSSIRESVTKTTEFIGKSVAAKGEATEQDLTDATRAVIPGSVKKAHKEALIKAVMNHYGCPKGDAKSLIKTSKKRRKKARRKERQDLSRVIREIPGGSLPNSAQAANKARLSATADSAINSLMAETAEVICKSATPVIEKSAPVTREPFTREQRLRMFQRVINQSDDPAEREWASKAIDDIYGGR